MTGAVAITGASGLMGRHLCDSLLADGVPVRRLVRRPAFEPDEVTWDPATGADPRALEGVEAVVHLAGESMLGRWTERKKEAILRSRVDGTRSLCSTLAAMDAPPRVLVSASAVGYYGDRGEEVLTEASRPEPGEGGSGAAFLSHVCQRWEMATQEAEEAGIRVVHLRSGVILDRDGGALAQMLPFFRAGLGGRLGNGKQWMPWITNHDQTRVIRHLVRDDRVSEPIDSVAASVRNQDLTDALGRVLHRPTVVAVPGPAARIVFGEVAEATLLASQHVVPDRLPKSGFTFDQPDLEVALHAVLAPDHARRPAEVEAATAKR